ncbi:forkhead box protein R1 [Elgaria multicarinata webbii]|uniref:forkhead box protein R1 n=1 Tax=Elgaria multicarinata webbii TaxID=159646 RepID=UPI002FCCC147
MDLRLQKPAFWASLHLRSGLRGWDLARELALGATCDQLPHGQEGGGAEARGGAASPFSRASPSGHEQQARGTCGERVGGCLRAWPAGLPAPHSTALRGGGVGAEPARRPREAFRPRACPQGRLGSLQRRWEWAEGAPVPCLLSSIHPLEPSLWRAPTRDPEEMPPPSPALKQRPWELEPPLLFSQAETLHPSSPGASGKPALKRGPGSAAWLRAWVFLSPAGSEVQPHLWMWVNPSLVCPVPGHASEVVGPFPLAGSLPPPSCLDLLPLPTATGAEKVPWEEAASQPGPVVLEKMEGTCGSPPVPRKAKVLRFRSRKLKRAQGGWPRPPLNYCILISLALSSSADSSLTVQEIYQFTRQHFPFFRTAPEGWKNTVRHNLCFSSSFEKTTDFVCLEGNRKSRLWRLTTEGRRKFQEEAQTLTEDMVGLVHQSMDKPELLQSLFGL